MYLSLSVLPCSNHHSLSRFLFQSTLRELLKSLCNSKPLKQILRPSVRNQSPTPCPSSARLLFTWDDTKLALTSTVGNAEIHVQHSTAHKCTEVQLEVIDLADDLCLLNDLKLNYSTVL